MSIYVNPETRQVANLHAPTHISWVLCEKSVSFDQFMEHDVGNPYLDDTLFVQKTDNVKWADYCSITACWYTSSNVSIWYSNSTAAVFEYDGISDRWISRETGLWIGGDTDIFVLAYAEIYWDNRPI